MSLNQAFGGVNHGFQVGHNSGQIENVNITTVHSVEDVDRLCMRTLRCPDSFAVKNRLKTNKDKLVYASIEWIFQDPLYIGWQDGEETGLLWIKGGAGKGKTMMSIGLIERLLLARNGTCMVTYFFCQNADYELNSLESIIKGLILQLINQQDGLKLSLRSRWDTANSRFEEDVSSWRVLWGIFLEMLDNCKCQRVYVLVDALDECRDSGMADFLKLIVRTGLHQISKIKWLLTSRPLESAERELLVGNDQVQVSLELHSHQFSKAIRTYVTSKVAELDRRHRYQEELRKQIETILNDKSEGTYLWVSLACKRLETVHRDGALSAIQQLPPGLHSFYHRMYSQLGVGQTVDRKRCIELLDVMMLVYQPIQVVEVESLTGFTDDYSEIEALVGKCASFITMRETFIEFIHQSARDYLAEGKRQSALIGSHEHVGHGELALRCLSYISARLKVNLCDLPRPDSTRRSIEESKNKEQATRLSRLNYAAIFWPRHFESGKQSTVVQIALGEHGPADEFLRTRLLEWLECLSLLDKLPVALGGLQAINDTVESVSSVAVLAQDATRFLLRHYHTISNWPLQIYSSGIIFSPEKSIARGENMEKIPLWFKNVPPMESVWSSLIQTLSGHSSTVSDLAFSPNGKYIVSGSSDRTIKLWDATTGDLQKTLGGHTETVNAVVFSSDSRTIISASYDKTVKLWDVITGDTRKTLRGHVAGVKAVALSSNGKFIASASMDTTIKLWDIITGDLQRTLEGNLHNISALTFSSDGKYIMAGFTGGTIKLWDTTTGDLQKTFRRHLEPNKGVVVCPNGKLIFSRTSNVTTELWDPSTCDIQRTISGYSAVNVLAISHTGKHIALGYNTGSIELRDSMIDDLLQMLEVDALARNSHKATAGSSSADRRITSGRIDDDTKLHNIASIEGHLEKIFTVIFSSDGKRIASASRETIKLWDVTTGDLQETLGGHSHWITGISFSPDDKHIASGSYDQTIKLWDSTTGDPRKTLRGHMGIVSAIAFSPDGKYIASGSDDHTVKLWDAMTGEIQKTFGGRLGEVHSVAFSPDGKCIASGSYNSIKLWDIATGGLQKTLKGDPMPFTTLAFSPDCSYIASTSRYKGSVINIWAIARVLNTTKSLSTRLGLNFRLNSFKRIQTQGVHTLKFSADGRSLKTNVGVIRLESCHPEGDSSPLENIDALYVRGRWILYGDLPILRLPFDFELLRYDVQDDRVAIGFGNGRVLGFIIDRTRLQALQINKTRAPIVSVGEPC